MKIEDLLDVPAQLDVTNSVIASDTSLPTWTAVGSLAGPDIHQLMIHFHRNDELNCILLDDEEVEFIGHIYHKVMDVPRYQPTDEELIAIKCLNLKLAMCGSKAN